MFDRRLLIPILLLTAACADESGNGPSDEGATEVLEVSPASLTIGETMLLRGTSLYPEDAEDTVVLQARFEGVFIPDDGGSDNVDFEVRVVPDATLEDGTQVVRWSRFGPFGNPFSDRNEVGTFRGTVTVTVTHADGTVGIGEPSQPLTISVEPSIIIEELQPIIAECGAPALRGLGGLPYQVSARAIGLIPTQFTWEFDDINGLAGRQTFQRSALGFTDTFGVDEILVFNHVPPGTTLYVNTIRVIAEDDAGNSVETALPLSVHRPLEWRYDGQHEVAEYLPPVPVSSCIPGSAGGRVTYTETETETRQQTVSVTISRNWSVANGVTNTVNWQEGYTEGTTTSTTAGASFSTSESASTGQRYGVSYNQSTANSVGFSTTDGETWGVDYTQGTTDTDSLSRMDEISQNESLATEVNASIEIGIPGIGGFGGGGGATATTGSGSRQSWGSESSSARSRSQGYSAGGSRSSTASYGSTTTQGASQSFEGSYTLTGSRTQGRTFSNTESRNQSRTYSVGGSASDSQVVTEGMSESESRSWSRSESSSTLRSYTGAIAPGRFGVFYRQTARMIRRAELVTYNLCGVADVQGEMMFNEWTWAPELAIAETCGEVLPPSSLPRAECFIPPCVL